MRYIAIIGCRTWYSYDDFMNKISYYLQNIDGNITFVSNNKNSLIERFCIEHDLPLIQILPNWERHGKAAAYYRNVKVVTKADLILVFNTFEKDTSIIKRVASTMNKPIKITNLKKK